MAELNVGTENHFDVWCETHGYDLSSTMVLEYALLDYLAEFDCVPHIYEPMIEDDPEIGKDHMYAFEFLEEMDQEDYDLYAFDPELLL